MSIDVKIFGSHYTFDGDDTEHIRKLADYVDRKMYETAKSIRNVTTSKVAVLAAMNLADELLTLRASQEDSASATTDRLDKLIAMSKRLASASADGPDQP